MNLAADIIAADAVGLEHLDAPALVELVLRGNEFGRVCAVSSFGAEAAVLLHLVGTVDPSTPILLVDTKKLFGETLRYAETLRDFIGLRDLRILTPDILNVARQDPHGDLWHIDADACCFARKVSPLEKALAEGFDTWITGRKRFQGKTRAPLAKVEFVDGRHKINPLADWTKSDLVEYFDKHQLPRHPLEADGFLSIGCFTCTDRVAPGEDFRAGRWRGSDKTECGIHFPAGAGGARLPGK
jgi:phosphoadenosine phosphosulfate reductase